MSLIEFQKWISFPQLFIFICSQKRCVVSVCTGALKRAQYSVGWPFAHASIYVTMSEFFRIFDSVNQVWLGWSISANIVHEFPRVSRNPRADALQQSALGKSYCEQHSGEAPRNSEEDMRSDTKNNLFCLSVYISVLVKKKKQKINNIIVRRIWMRVVSINKNKWNLFNFAGLYSFYACPKG